MDQVISGTHNVIFRFRTNNDESADLVDIDSFVFDYLYQIPSAGWSASSGHSAGTKYFDVEKYNSGTKNARSNSNDNTYIFADGLSDEIKALFASASDSSVISKTYTDSMVNYIGFGSSGEYNIKPAITGIILPKGEYTLYYIGGNSNDIQITFENDTQSTVSVLPVGKYTFSTYGLMMHESRISFSEDYTGDITFYNSGKWLPDLYAVKLVSEDNGGEINADLDTDTVYTADMLVDNPSYGRCIKNR
ncbi:MAG: hypothetical protein ACI4TH_09005 [Candidatus Ornithomonoglobus sp.]